MAFDPRRLLLLVVADRAGGVLHGREDPVVGGAHPFPLVLRLRRIHEVQRTGRGLAQIRTQPIQNRECNKLDKVSQRFNSFVAQLGQSPSLLLRWS